LNELLADSLHDHVLSTRDAQHPFASRRMAMAK